jgi:2-desacetyl-2-hydroxyethyl bacteriochlorophyllide A dehydrogenase
MPRELWFVGPHRVELREGVAPDVLAEAGQVRARALCSGVSQGTELLLYRGEGPRVFDPSLDPPDTPTYPRRYGYAWVGEITLSRADELPVGQRVFALRPHGDLHVLAVKEARRLPASVPAPRATLAANLETALTAVWDADVSLGDRVVVVGGGVVGLLCALLAKRSGAEHVRLVEPSPRRRAVAAALGIDEALAPAQDVGAAEADVVLEASGDPACLDRAIAHAGEEADVVVVSFYGERRSPVALGSDFHRRRLRLKASQVSHLPLNKSARWTRDRRFAQVLELLADPRLDLLVDPPLPFASAPAVYARLDAEPGSALQTVFAYDG